MLRGEPETIASLAVDAAWGLLGLLGLYVQVAKSTGTVQTALSVSDVM